MTTRTELMAELSTIGRLMDNVGEGRAAVRASLVRRRADVIQQLEAMTQPSVKAVMDRTAYGRQTSAGRFGSSALDVDAGWMACYLDV